MPITQQPLCTEVSESEEDTEDEGAQDEEEEVRCKAPGGPPCVCALGYAFTQQHLQPCTAQPQAAFHPHYPHRFGQR